MELLASMVVHKPLNILLVAVLFGIGLQIRRGSAGGSPTSMLIVAAGWALYAAWEWLVMTRTPEANIRVDLLVIWPVLLALSGWSIYLAFKA